MNYLVKMEQVCNSYKEVEADSPEDALRNAKWEYLMHPDRFTWSKGEVYAKDVDLLDG
jgi:hypothetical protein